MNCQKYFKAKKDVLNLAVSPIENINKKWGVLQMLLSVIFLIIPIPMIVIELVFNNLIRSYLDQYLYIIFLIPTFLILHAAARIQMKFKSEEEIAQELKRQREERKAKLSRLNILSGEGLELLINLKKSKNIYDSKNHEVITGWKNRVMVIFNEIDSVMAEQWAMAHRYPPLIKSESGEFDISLTGVRSTSSDDLRTNIDWASYLSFMIDKLNGYINELNKTLA